MIQEFIEKIAKEVDYVHNFFEQNGCLKHAVTYKTDLLDFRTVQLNQLTGLFFTWKEEKLMHKYPMKQSNYTSFQKSNKLPWTTIDWVIFKFIILW